MSDYLRNPLYRQRNLYHDATGPIDPGDVPAPAHTPHLGEADPRTLEHPAATIDARNGWHDRGNPLENFDEPSESPITLAADELARLFSWLLIGGEKRSGPAPAAARDMSGHQLEKALRRPSIIGCRVVACLLRIRPDLLNGQAAKQIARKLRISPRMMAFYTMNFGEHFPTASKTIRRKSRVLTEQAHAARHAAKAKA